MVDAMAASSGGTVDWSLVLKPFLSPNYEQSNINELLELCSTIVKSESEIWRHKESHKNFYNTFAVLAADYISSSVSKLSCSQLETASAACRVLLKYLLCALQSASSEQYQDSAAIERYLVAIQVLCIGTGLLTTKEVSSLVDTMKGENPPQGTTPGTPGSEKEPKQESSKKLTDLSVTIFERLTLPMREGPLGAPQEPSTAQSSPLEPLPNADPSSEIHRLFLRANTENLQSLRAGETLVDLCLNLPAIKKSKTKVEEALAGRNFSIPANHTEALAHRNALPQTVSEITLAMSAINLPVLEPLSSAKLDKLCSLAMAVLHCAVAQAASSACLSTMSAVSPKTAGNQAATLKEEDLDANAVKLVEEALSMYSYIGGVIKGSTRAGGHVYQNYLLAGAWVLITGLQTHLTQTTSAAASEKSSAHSQHKEGSTDKGRSPSKTQSRESSASGSSSGARTGLQKFQQSFGVLSVALTSKTLMLLTELFEDLALEVCGGAAGSIIQVEPAPLAIMGQFTALQRVARVLSAAPLNHLLFYLAIVSYRKACSLKRLVPAEGDYGRLDTAGYTEDLFDSTCDSTDEDEDSEPILGQWFEETLAPPEPSECPTPSPSDADSKSNNQSLRGPPIVPEKGEVDGYINLSTGIFVFLNRHFLCSKSTLIARYVKNGLTEQQMIILAALIRDLDREWASSEFGSQYSEFSNALMKFTHNLITSQNLQALQACLLNHLGVSPWTTDVPHAWPLQVYPRTLTVLAQVLLLRPQNEKEASVISIWHRLVNTLIENVLNTNQTSSEDIEDLNVEHAEVLLYLFHSLNLMQKKSVVLLMAGGVLRCSEIARNSLKDTQLLNLSRLLLLFDYIMKHLYDVPSSLLEKIQHNLFELTNLSGDSKDCNLSKMEAIWAEVEEPYRKITSEHHPSPKFYRLSHMEVNNQDAPKLDGLACNFILGTPDKLRYPLLLDALIEILNITHVVNASSGSKMTILGLCATQYCFTICWRLLQLLPPSIPYMERLATGEAQSPGPLLMHSLIWGPRSSHKNFNRWLKDCLVKQGMYTQNTDKLVKAVSDAVNSVDYDAVTAKNCIVALTPEVGKGFVPKESLPPLWQLMLLDCLVAKVEVSLEEMQQADAGVSVSERSCIQDLVPHVLKLAQAILHCTRLSTFYNLTEQADKKVQMQEIEALYNIIAILSGDNELLSSLAKEVRCFLPNNVCSALLEWRSEDAGENSIHDLTDVIPSETYILKIINIHISSLSRYANFSIDISLKRLLETLVKFTVAHAPKIENTDTKNKAIEMLVSITCDARTEFLYHTAAEALDKMIGDCETDERQKRLYIRILDHTYNLLMSYTTSTEPQKFIKESILHSCLKFYEKIIEKASGRQALETFFTGDKNLVKVLMSVSNPKMSQQYSTSVLQFFNKLFQAAEKSSTDPSLNYLCSSIGKLAEVDSEKLQAWLKQIILGPSNVESPESPPESDPKKLKKDEENMKIDLFGLKKSVVQENSQLLQALTSFIVKQNSNVSEEVSVTILKALIPLGSQILSPPLEGTGFTELMNVMMMLADAGLGKGHAFLFPAAAEWVEICVKHVNSKEIFDKIATDPESMKDSSMLNAASCILEYLSDVVLQITDQPPRSVSPPWEHESPLDLDVEWQDDNEEGNDSGEDSDEDSLCNKLCTFTFTQKEFMNQHWYHCHTCRMLDGVGVCSICARVCHKGHDLSYAKYGNFFCDCGAKEDGSCQALVKRTSEGNQVPPKGQKEEGNDASILAGLLRRRTSSPIPTDRILFDEKRRDKEKKKLEESRETLLSYLSCSNVTGSLLDFLKGLIPAIEATCNLNSPVGCHARGVKALEQLYSAEKKYQYTDQLMVPTLGSQEGAFENVRMSYAGDQGQTIRQLLSAHIIRRVAMCCMTTTQGKRQHLAVSHEKGKITVLQLSALLKQADSATRKLTLTRLSSAPIPFTVLSMTSNLCNEDFLAVCGLKDCHVLTFNSNGQVTDHLVLHPQLETGNFIIKAIWLPGSQTKLALVTADFVKIFDLNKDAANPSYHFLVPSGKIRDCTFMYEDGTYHILLMSSPGHIYTEVLNDDSSTKYGSFYVTNTLEVFHLDVTDNNGQVAGGGVSIYYSHTLMLLFYSYAQGKSFISPIVPKSNCLSLVFPITLPQTSNGSSKSNSSRSPAPQPLCQWTEIPNHPGIICCAMQSTNQPVVLMLKPDTVVIQEIKVVPAKSKIMDMVAIRHNSGSDYRTTLILLCEDGSLKMFIANMEQTGFWMSSSIQAVVPIGSSLKPKKKKAIKSGKPSSTPVFPVDFFEHCTPMNDVEFGGNDLLQIYNAAQLKHRLNTTGLYVVCNKAQFQIEATNNDSTMVMCGIRVLIGTQDAQKAPSYVEVFGRIISFNATRSRWFDVPFSREESLQADKKLTIVFGPCQDPELMTMVDSLKVYGKTKDAFGWPEDNEEAAESTTNTNSATNGNTTEKSVSQIEPSSNPQQLTKLERLAMDVFKSLDAALYIYACEEKFAKLKPIALNIATQLLTLPTPPSIQVHSKALLLTLHPTKQQYHGYKDQALLQHVLTELTSMTERKESEVVDLDAESFYRLLLIVRGIAIARPQNLVKFADGNGSIKDVDLPDPLASKKSAKTEPKPGSSKEESQKRKHLLSQLMEVLWLLHKLNPDIPSLAPVVVPGLKYTEQVIHALVEIIHAFNSSGSEAYRNVTIRLYLQLLLCEDPVIAFSAKLALCKVLKPRVKRRRVFIPSPTREESPERKELARPTQLPPVVPQETIRPVSVPVAIPAGYEVDMVEAIGLLEQPNDNHNINPLEALLGGGGFPPILDIPPDADDETIVELAIALSLQEQANELGVDQNQDLQQLQAQLRGAAAAAGQAAAAVAQAQHEAANFSDTTASAAGSDDEGSTAATDGSTLRTSPAEQGGSGAGSESGGSAVDSITGEHNVSGRSSAYGDDGTVRSSDATSSSTAATTEKESEMQKIQEIESETATQNQEDQEVESENNAKLHSLRLQLLNELISFLPLLKNADGARTVPFFQVVSQLTLDLDGQFEKDKICLNKLLTAISDELKFTSENVQEICTRSKVSEVHLLLLKLISNLLQRNKSSSSSKSTSSDTSNYVPRTSATFLHKADIIGYCLKISQALLNDYWKKQITDENSNAPTTGNLLKPHLNHPLPDMTPFFLKSHLKENSTDIFWNYSHLLTETILRLPYQVQRLSEVNESVITSFDSPWYKYLCEYMMLSLPPTSRRNARKLLLYICGNKEKYRQLRDLHALSTHLKGVKQCVAKGGYQQDLDLQHDLSLPYDSLVELVEHLKACLDIALFRTGNWQRFCLHTEEVLPFLLRVSFLLEDGVAPTILQLLTSALVVNANQAKKNEASSNSKASSSRKDREKSDDSGVEALFEETNCIALVEQINKQVSKEILARFIKTFTLENNTTSVRWQAHSLILALYKNSKPKEQEELLELLWKLWPLLPAYGKKAAQFVDLLGYFSLRYTEKKEGEHKIEEYVEKAVSVLRAQNETLAHHPNANLYARMSQFVELDGYYLESEPCLVCNNPEVPFSSIKLSAIKVDSKFTTTTQIVKLLSSHIISKISVRIGDLKKTKMVRTINIYYNNRTVQAVVELKNKPALWHKAKKVTLQSGQTEVKIEFPLPIVACNLMIEYSDFYENIQASSETLQCPRCSASVPANPGVCANCGENVFQCHKCRAINYDEKDPFLCHACGFCKYAKFDFTLQAKPCCAVEPIENDEDKKKTVSSINTLLEKADRIYKQLIGNKPSLESLLVKIAERRSDKKDEPTSGPAPQGPTANNAIQLSQVKVNKTIQMLAQQYCNECKTSFEELSKIIQKVLASRKELVSYERKHHDLDLPESTSVFDDLQIESGIPCVTNKCYGCATAATEHCLTLLRALALNKTTRQTLCSYGLVQELVWNNLRKGSVHNQEDVRLLLCMLTRDNQEATEDLCKLLTKRINTILTGDVNSSDLGANIRHEIALLAAMVEKEDDCWELKLSCMMSLFLKACEDFKSPLVMESVILPCLKIIQGLMKARDTTAPVATSKKAKDKDKSSKLAVVPKFLPLRAPVEVKKFLNKDPNHSFSGWKARITRKTEAKPPLPLSKEEVRKLYLQEKYARKWSRYVKRQLATDILKLGATSWIETVLFNPSSRQARQVAWSIIEAMCNSYERKKEVITLLTYFLSKLSKAGESAAEFLSLYQTLIQEGPWKQYLTSKGLLMVLANLMTAEIEQLHRLEATTLTSDLAQGYALNQITELLSSFLDNVAIRRQYKGRLVGAVLNGYLSLRRLVVQRTRLIDDTQETLLNLLEEMTSGTEEETKAFMSICIKTVEKYPLTDILTPVFIFERLCSIIYPEENDIGEFFLTLEKDAQQEDFLQGRMLGNPYSSNEAGLGPLMRDVKNKICQDCELVALLEDDNGMELLVNNKIMSLDLPVKDVYKKVWLAEGGDPSAMRVVYRMRGLLGDATEEFIETLENKGKNEVDNEEVYKMANVLADCGGLKVMVTRLGAIQNVWRAKPLLQVLLKLFRLSVKVVKCQEVLIEPELGAMEVFLRILHLCLEKESESGQLAIIEQLLDIMETLLAKATSKPLESFKELSATFGEPEYVKTLLSFTTNPSVKNNTAVLEHLTRVLAALVYGNDEKMEILLSHFKPVLEFNKYDIDHSTEDQQRLEMFCLLTNSIEKNAIGNTLKDYIISLNILKEALDYITMHAPCVKPTLLRTDSDELKDFISKPALKYILRFLTGLAHSHENTQMEISKADTIPIIHRLEQVSSDEHVGSLAENLLEALCTNPVVAEKIEQVRDFTRSEKKRLAMAMREKQLGQLGMRTNDKGQVTAKSTILQQIEELGDESGLVCCICREGYKYQPTKVLGIYTFTKRCNVEEYELKQRKTVGYSTVTHFNVVHIDCHMSAVRLARARDEWESAALQNANTKCNGLLPLWGPQVPESAFASCLARHNTYLQESTNHRDIGHSSTIHDLKLLLFRFAQEKPFHEDTGGGGPQSNLHMVPYLIHVGLYVINTTRVYSRESTTLQTYISNDMALDSAYQSEGTLYMAAMTLFLRSKSEWEKDKVAHLNRLLITAHARITSPVGPSAGLTDRCSKVYAIYKPYLVFWGLIDGIYKYFFKDVEGENEQWPTNLADYIRHNDEALIKSSEKLLSYYTDELLPCASLMEFCDVVGLLEKIPNPDEYINSVLDTVK